MSEPQSPLDGPPSAAADEFNTRSPGSDSGRHDPYAVLRLPHFRRYLLGHVVVILGMQMQLTAVGYEIYRRTGREDSLGWAGVAQFLPRLLLLFVSGHLADRYDRRYVVMGGLCLVALGSVGLSVISLNDLPVSWMYGCLLLAGIGNAVQQPAKAALLPQVVPRDRFTTAIGWNMSAFQFSSVTGPLLAGALIWLLKRSSSGEAGWSLGVFEPLRDRAAGVFMCEALAALFMILILPTIPIVRESTTAITASVESLGEGVRFVWRNRLLLAALSLDLFAVLLGGATALLPVFQSKILLASETALGAMMAAPPAGALLMGLFLAHRPPIQRSGRALLLSVVGFGLATIVFGLSTNLWLSLAMLLVTGALDYISVVVRHSLVQLLTPDSMRGRVSAVNGIFIGASNELGAAESGFLAQLTSPVVSVVTGGVGSILVAAVTAIASKELRMHGRLDETRPSE